MVQAIVRKRAAVRQAEKLGEATPLATGWQRQEVSFGGGCTAVLLRLLPCLVRRS